MSKVKGSLPQMKRNASFHATKHNNIDEEFDENVIFLINKTGFPIDEEVWNRTWKFAEFLYPTNTDSINEILINNNDEEIKVPNPPLTFMPGLSTSGKLECIQKYMKELQYNHTGTQFFDIKKYRSFTGLMDDAKLMIKHSLPIKCLEAVILGLYFTMKIDNLTRFTIGFKTKFENHTHRHVVLGVYSCGYFGAIGMSRRNDLMYKPLIFKSLSDLIFDFQACYKNYWHVVKSVKIGLPVNNQLHSFEPIPWKGIVVYPSKNNPNDLRTELERYSKILRNSYYGSQTHLASQVANSIGGGLSRSASVPSLNKTSSPRKSYDSSVFMSPEKSTSTRKKNGGFLIRV